MKFKRIIAIILVFAFAAPCLNVGALFSYAKTDEDPFYFYNISRERSIDAALSKRGGGKNGESGISPVYSRTGLPEVKRTVRFRQEAGLCEIYDAVRTCGFELLANSSERVFSLYFKSESEALDFEKKYSGIIRYFEEIKYKTISAVTLNDELSSDYWAYDSLFAYDAWEFGFGSRDVVIAVLDSGIFRNHEDLEGSAILDGYDAVTKKTGVNSDEEGHGTKVTGIIAATPNNGKGISGIAPGCTILPVKIVSEKGTISSADFAEAVYFAADSGASVINLSFGGYDYVEIEADAVKYANGKGCIVVSSSGNEGDDYQAGAYSYPASYDGVISVGACDSSGNICLFSQFNDKVTVAAPGSDIITLNRYNGYSLGISGTSFSCAFVSGAAGLLLSRLGDRQDVSGELFRKLIEAVSKTKYDTRSGWGILNIQAMMEYTEKAEVIGVKNGELYFGNVRIWFMNGSATLDGKSFSSGSLCKYSGKHTLELVWGTETQTVTFTTDNIPLTFDYKESSDGARIRFSRGKATVDGFPYSSGELITSSGTHIFRLTGPNGNTKDYSFTLDFTAPSVCGVEDGGIYTSPRCISFIGEGAVTLNGKSVQSGHIVSDAGKYEIVSSAKHGTDQIKINFEIKADENVKRYNAPAGADRIFVSEKNGYAVLYGKNMRSMYVYDTDDMRTAKKVMKLKGYILCCFEYNGRMAAVTEESVFTFDVRELTVPGSPAMTEIKNEHLIESCVFEGGRLFYIEKGSGYHRNVYEYSFDSGLTRRVKTVDNPVSMICCDSAAGVLVTAAPYSDDVQDVLEGGADILVSFPLSGEGKERTVDLGNSYGDRITAYNGMTCIGGSIISSSDGRFVLRTKDVCETPVYCDGSIYVTDRYVYDIASGKPIGVVPDKLYDAAVTAERVYMLGESGLTVSGGFVYAFYGDPLPAEKAYDRDVNRKELTLDKTHTSWSIDEKTGTAYCVSSTDNTLDIIDIRSLSFKDRVYLRYLPEKALFHNGKVIVMFSDINELYFYDPSSGVGSYASYGALKEIEDIGADGDRLFILSGGSVYADSTEPGGVVPVRVFTDENIDSFTVVPEIHKIYLVSRNHGTLSSEITRCDTVSLTELGKAEADQVVYSLIYGEGTLLTGNAAYSAETLELIGTFDSALKAKKGDFAVTSSGIVSLTDLTYICKYDFSSSLVYMDDGYNCVMEKDGVLCRVVCSAGSTPLCEPKVSGADNGTNYTGSTVIEYDTGVAYLDGEKIESGRFVNDGGSHTLTVILPYDRFFTYNFAIDARLEGISVKNGDIDLKATEKATLEVELYPKGSPDAEITFVSSDPSVARVDADGTVTALNKGRAVITASVFGGEHTSSVTVTVSELTISFKTDAFIHDTGLIKGINPGITVSGMIGALSKECAGSAVVFDANNETVKSGAVTTGMTLALLNDEGGVVDSAVLCVAGDVDGDGTVTVGDYVRIKKALDDVSAFSATEAVSADVNLDGKVDIIDALRVENHILGRQQISAYQGVIAANETVRSEITTTDISSGGEFTVRVILHGSGPVYGVSARLSYDSALFTYKKAEKKDVSWKFEAASRAGEISFLAYDASGGGMNDPDGLTVASLVFRAAEGIEAGTSAKLDLTGMMIITADGVESSADKTKTSFVTDASVPTSAQEAPQLTVLEPDKGTLLPEFDASVCDYVLFVPEDAYGVSFRCESNYPDAAIIRNIPETLGMTSKCEIVCSRGDLKTIYTVTVRKNVNQETTARSTAMKIVFITFFSASLIALAVFVWSLILYLKKRRAKKPIETGTSGEEEETDDGE